MVEHPGNSLGTIVDAPHSALKIQGFSLVPVEQSPWVTSICEPGHSRWNLSHFIPCPAWARGSSPFGTFAHTDQSLISIYKNQLMFWETIISPGAPQKAPIVICLEKNNAAKTTISCSCVCQLSFSSSLAWPIYCEHRSGQQFNLIALQLRYLLHFQFLIDRPDPDP